MIDPKLLRTELDTVAEKLAKRGYEPVSYTHLTLPTICSV